MSKLQALVYAVCLTSIAIAMLDIISSGEKLKKQLRLIFSCVFLVVLVTPFLSGEIELSVPTSVEFSENEQLEVFTSSAKNSVALQTEQALEFALSQKLETVGISADKICVSVNIEDEYSIDINKVQIVLTEKSQEVATLSLLTELLGADCKEIEVLSKGEELNADEQ